MCARRPAANGFYSQHQRQINKTSETIDSSKDPVILNSQSRQAAIAMSEFLAATPATNQGFRLLRLSNDFGADLDWGFDIDTAGLTSTLQKELADVSKTLTLSTTQINTCLLRISRTPKGKKRIQNFKSSNELYGPDVSCYLSCSRNTFPLLIGVWQVPSQPTYPTDHDRQCLSSGIDWVLLWRLAPTVHLNM